MSKFDYGSFVGGHDTLAVSKEKYTKEQAIEIARQELHLGNPCYLAMSDGFTVHRAGINEDGEPCVCWWLEYNERKRSCPCWVFHLTPNKDEKFFKGYNYIQLNPYLTE